MARFPWKALFLAASHTTYPSKTDSMQADCTCKVSLRQGILQGIGTDNMRNIDLVTASLFLYSIIDNTDLPGFMPDTHALRYPLLFVPTSSPFCEVVHSLAAL